MLSRHTSLKESLTYLQANQILGYQYRQGMGGIHICFQEKREKSKVSDKVGILFDTYKCN